MILAILQARYSSSRLPGKVMKPILGKPMLQLQLERLGRVTKIDQLVVATSTDTSDDPIQGLCDDLKINCFRGSLEDVLDRYYQAVKKYNADDIVRITGDCPVIDPEIIDQLVEFYLKGEFDYASYCVEPTFPDGLDSEIFSFSALKAAWKEGKLPSQREHVTPFIHYQPERFIIGSMKGDVDLSYLRWTVDEPEDFEFVTQVYEALYPDHPEFTTNDILELLKNRPELQKINQAFQRNQGAQKSLIQDKQLKEMNLVESLSIQNRAKNLIPGMTQLLSKRPDRFSMGVWPGYFSKAQGVLVWDLDGNQFIDMSIGGIGANVLGYCDPDVDDAVRHAIDLGTSTSLNCPEEVELAELLCEIHPWSQKVRYARTGGEAMAIAIRIARASTKRDKIAFCGYHGWHDWYLAANVGTEDALGEHLITGLEPIGVPKALQGTAFPFRYNQLNELKHIVSRYGKELAAIVMEPIRSEWPEKDFLQSVRQIADETGTVLIMDEISAGFRMNTGGAHLKLGIEPDIAVFSKALGNGYPMAAIIGNSKVMQAAELSFISSTCWTERIGPVAALGTIRKHQQVDAGERLMVIGQKVQDGWNKLAQKHRLPIQVSGIPPLSHFVFQHAKHNVLKALFVQLMLEKSFLASTSFYSMYAHQDTHILQYLQAVDEAFTQIVEWLQKGNLEKHLIGKPSVGGFQRLS